MRYLFWALRIILFVFLFGFAVNNTESIALHFYLDYEWEAPLIVILLLFFIVGVAAGVFASLSYIFRQKREIQVLKKQLQKSAQSPGSRLNRNSDIIDAI